MQLCVESNNVIYEISELCTDISFKEELNNGPSILEFSLIRDDIQINNGESLVRACLWSLQ